MKKTGRINILMVEDDKKMRETLGDILTREGYKVTGAGTLAVGKQEIRERPYDIALIDINLPDGVGLDLLYEIKKLDKKTSAIILTGAADLESATFALNTGAFAYLKKPVNIEMLKKYIKKVSDTQ
jgi:DNA-binding NtrC family response regulator